MTSGVSCTLLCCGVCHAFGLPGSWYFCIFLRWNGAVRELPRRVGVFGIDTIRRVHPLSPPTNTYLPQSDEPQWYQTPTSTSAFIIKRTTHKKPPYVWNLHRGSSSPKNASSPTPFSLSSRSPRSLRSFSLSITYHKTLTKTTFPTR